MTTTAHVQIQKLANEVAEAAKDAVEKFGPDAALEIPLDLRFVVFVLDKDGNRVGHISLDFGISVESLDAAIAEAKKRDA